MDIMNVWTAVEHMWVASGAAELAIFTAILYWFFTSSRVADMLEVVGEKVGGWCGRENSGSLRQAVRTRHRHHQASVHAKLESDAVTRASSLYRVKEGPTVPAPKPIVRPSTGLACLRCAPVSRESWHDTKSPDTDTVINVLDIGRQRFANGGVVSRYLCDLAQCLNLVSYDYKDFVPEVLKDEHFQQAIEEQAQDELKKLQEENQKKGSGDEQSGQYPAVRSRVEKKAYSILVSISSAMSNSVLRLAAWIVHKAIRRVAGGVCGTRSACIERLRRAKAAGLPLVFVPLHRSHFDYILVSFVLYISGLRPPLVAAGDNMRIPFFGWLLRGCGAFYIRRRTEGSDNHTDPLYKAALRSYILNSLSQNNNLEFFIEGGRTRTGKPGLPKAGILSVILDAYLDGTIDDALLVPVTMNYDRLVDGNFVREQLGMPKQMETFWSALRGIWSTLCTNHGGIRVDFNQPISLKELVTSFQNYSYLKCPVERTPAPPNNNLSVNLDRQILYNHSHSSLYGSQVGADHKMMVEAIGRHLVYDASQSTAMMCTNVMAYVLLTTAREGCTFAQLRQLVATRGDALRMEGRDLGYMGDPTKRALDTLSRGLVRRSGSGDTQVVAPVLSVAASLELSYYANSLVAHYASTAIVATALESLICEPDADPNEVRHTRLIESALQLYEILSHELIICPPCKRSEDEMLDALGALLASDVITAVQPDTGLEEQRWSRRLAARMEEDGEIEPSSENVVRYRVNRTAEAIRERRRLVLTLRPLLEAYAATCRVLTEGPQRALVTQAMDSLVQAYTQDRMRYGEAISVDAIRNCHSLLRQWGLIDIYTENRQRHIRFLPPYDNRTNLDQVCANLYRFNMDTPLLQST